MHGMNTAPDRLWNDKVKMAEEGASEPEGRCTEVRRSTQ